MNHISNVHDHWPAEGLETLGHCPVCRSTQSEIAYEGCRDVVFGLRRGSGRCTAAAIAVRDIWIRARHVIRSIAPIQSITRTRVVCGNDLDGAP